MQSDIKYWKNRRYTAWFDPHFEIDSAFYEHMQHDERLEREIQQLAIDIWQNGMINPLLVTIRGGKRTIHPGKCRAKALKRLGRKYAPAVVVNYDSVHGPEKIPDGATFLQRRDQVEGYFGGDAVVEMSHRFLTVKKRRGGS